MIRSSSNTTLSSERGRKARLGNNRERIMSVKHAGYSNVDKLLYRSRPLEGCFSVWATDHDVQIYALAVGNEVYNSRKSADINDEQLEASLTIAEAVDLIEHLSRAIRLHRKLKKEIEA